MFKCHSNHVNQGSRKVRLSCPEGYTLIELTLVVFLIVLILSMATVFFANTLPAARLRATGREMAATIKYAKYLSRANNERQVFDIDLDSRTYAVRGRETRKMPSDVAVTVINTNLEAVRNGRFSIVFDALGCNDWQSIILDRGDKKIIIAMDPIMTAVIQK